MKPYFDECCVKAAQDKLKLTVLPWASNQSHPSNHVRNDGTGEQLAIVDRWCGGYQDSHFPVYIGWEARVTSGGNSVGDSGMVTVKYTAGLDKENLRGVKAAKKHLVTDAIQEAIDTAKENCDSALVTILSNQRPGARILGLTIIEEHECPHCGQSMCDDETCS